MALKVLMRNIILVIIVIPFIFSCSGNSDKIETPTEPYNKVNLPTDFYNRTVKKLTDVIVYDIFSPPVASRIYAYPSIAAYEILASQDSTYLTLAGQLHELESIPVSTESINHDVAAIQAFFTVGKALIFSAPSGSGKTTIVKHLVSKFPELAFSISATTRDPRKGVETNGVDYHFLALSDFKKA